MFTRWQEVEENGEWILYYGNYEAYRCRNVDEMTAIVDFAQSPYYHFIIDMFGGNVPVISSENVQLKRNPRYPVMWEEKE